MTDSWYGMILYKKYEIKMKNTTSSLNDTNIWHNIILTRKYYLPYIPTYKWIHFVYKSANTTYREINRRKSKNSLSLSLFSLILALSSSWTMKTKFPKQTFIFQWIWKWKKIPKEFGKMIIMNKIIIINLMGVRM